MVWHASLTVDYSLRAAQTVAHFRHSGPLRILQSLYPEGPGICHNVIVHPPGGMVGGDQLELQFATATGAHSVVTTPGATRFYRAAETSPDTRGTNTARQQVHLKLASQSRMEWLPLETIAYSGCQAENSLTMEIADGAELIGWDVTALGLPAANQPFVSGCFSQHIAWPGVWLEQAKIASSDVLLLDSPLGLAGKRCLATLFFASGSPLSRLRRQLALDSARACIEPHPLATLAGATSPDGRLVAVRVLAPQVEPAMDLLRLIADAWRMALWQLPACRPRIWNV